MEKKTNLPQKKTLGKYTILFFPRAPRMPFDNKILHTPCATDHLECQKNSYFLNFLAVLFEFTIHRHTNLLFSFG